MIVIILAGSGGSKLDAELQAYANLRGFPRALLPVRGKPIIEHWWEAFQSVREVTQLYVVANAARYKYFERWATSKGLPVHSVINNGMSDSQDGASDVHDLVLALQYIELLGVQLGSVCVVAGDVIFTHKLDFVQIIQSFRHENETVPAGISLVLSQKKLVADSSCCNFGTITLRDQNTIASFEKRNGEPGEIACLPFMILSGNARQQVQKIVLENKSTVDSFGTLFELLCPKVELHTVTVPSAFKAISGPFTLSMLDAIKNTAVERDESDDDMIGDSNLPSACEGIAYARVGLMGNPSDGYFGKTISATIRNFHATVWLEASTALKIVPHPLFDPCEFGSMGNLFKVCKREGYHGGVRLLLATCKRFYEFCTNHNIVLPVRNFTARYDTNVPRQVGLAGSSAIVTAFMRALMKFYGLTNSDIPNATLANLILAVELEEMGIAAGLQDRVVQVYEGLVYMDFNHELMKSRGSLPSDSGSIHSDVKQRFNRGEKEVVNSISKFAMYSDLALQCLQTGDHAEFGNLMNKNFEQRRAIFTDAVVGECNLELIQIGIENNACCKFPGSGGAIVGLAHTEADMAKLKLAYQQRGYVFVPIDFVDAKAEETSMGTKAEETREPCLPEDMSS